MTNDETMARIEAALDNLIDVTQYHADKQRFPRKAKADALALIRSKLPQPDAKPIDKPRSLLEGHGIGAGIDHRDPGAWGEDDDKSRANEEHERAVEAWATAFNDEMLAQSPDWSLPDDPEFKSESVAECHAEIRGLVEEALLLMRARPASGKDEAAGELLRAAKAAIIKEADNADEGYSAGLHRAAEILDEAAERAGIKP